MTNGNHTSVIPLEHFHNRVYDAVHFGLAVLYIFLLTFSLILFVRLVRQQKANFSWQKFYHPILILGCILRSVFFSLQPFIRESMVRVDNKINVFLNTFPSLLFFSDYLIILFLWIEIYHHSRGSHLGIDRFKGPFIAINALIYSVALLLYILDYILYPQAHYDTVSVSDNPVQKTIYLMCVSVYFFTSIGFLIYGLLFYWKFSSVPASFARKKIKRKIEIITVLVILCFMARTTIIILGSILYNLSKWPWFDGIYFTFLEVLPLAMMLYILHGAPKRTRGPNDPSSSSETTPLVN